ncbi:MAG: indolepyruvate oxidoreductase subunit beta family protein [Proteobacteria bacterium]|nr:indolepyruvate oxidoreductase subunit beta family protein [Pseudomonadota bacterium]
MRDETVKLALPAAGPATERPISIAIVAMGGQGGGVLTDWIVELGESQGWVAQSTSVPGVAQRTGATIYYVEMMPPLGGQKPILSLMPTPGDVDVVVASEFVEAGRAILRGIVTPERTTLIASSHRSFAVTEKMAPGNGVMDKAIVSDAIGVTAKKEYIFDMNALALRHGSVISAAMFGALAGSGVLPFPRESYIEIIRGGGKGVEASIRTFEAAFEETRNPTAPASETRKPAATGLPSGTAGRGVEPLVNRLRSELPAAAHDIAYAGLAKVVDFQDVGYGAAYLDLLARLHAADRQHGGETKNFLFTVTAAKYLANAMAYDDVIRVADLKTRSTRRARVEKEIGLAQDQVLQTTEFMHPRIEELMGMLPDGFARRLEKRSGLVRWLDARVNKGRRLRTYSLVPFLMLYVVGGLRALRRRSYRHAIEVDHRDRWLTAATGALAKNYQLGVEILQCRRLVKGYSDTHARGLSKFDKVMAAIALVEDRNDAADWARRLRESAIKDAAGMELDGTIETIKSFAVEGISQGS